MTGGKDVLAKAVRVAAAGSFLGRSVRQRALGHSRAGPDEQDREQRKNVKHGVPHNI